MWRVAFRATDAVGWNDDALFRSHPVIPDIKSSSFIYFFWLKNIPEQDIAEITLYCAWIGTYYELLNPSRVCTGAVFKSGFHVQVFSEKTGLRMIEKAMIGYLDCIARGIISDIFESAVRWFINHLNRAVKRQR